METMAAWTARICIAVAAGLPCDNIDGFALGTRELEHVSAGGSMALELANWNVLDLGTGNGLLLHALVKQGYITEPSQFPCLSLMFVIVEVFHKF
jgi:hypothetical protein